MQPTDNQAKLLRLLGNLAFYNDKGIEYARHSPTQVQAERLNGLAQISELVKAIGAESLPSDFRRAVESGTVATDFTGEYIGVLKAHFGISGAA